MQERKGGRNMSNDTQIKVRMPDNTEIKVRRKKQSQLAATLMRLSKNKVAMLGLAIIILEVIIAIISPLIMPYAYDEMDTMQLFATPNWHHIFGTNELGCDIFSRLLYGARASLGLGFVATALGTAAGIAIGLLVGYAGGKGPVDAIIMRLLDIISAIPGMLLAIAISVTLGTGFFNTVLAMSIGSVPYVVRLLRANILGIRHLEFVEAAESVNCKKARLMVKHILPNAISPIIVQVTMGIGGTILRAAALSFIGLGIQPPVPEWGAMLSAGRNYVRTYPHMLIFPGIAIAITVLAFNMLGDGLRDALDPRLKN
jgi:peptide/nickel transport system permease protein